MLPESQICWFCIHAKSRKGNGTKKPRIVRYCELGIKKLGASRHENFNRCKGFEPDAERIGSREHDLKRIERDCEAELSYLARLRVYMEHKRRRGAVYEKQVTYFEPIYREDDENRQR